MKKVLIIEDNEKNLYLMKYMIENLGHQVIEARDGAEGLRLAFAEKPDLVLLDIQLPVLDGYAVVGKIREADVKAEIPVIAVTSFAMVGDREKCLAAGCTGYMEKPIDPETFLREVKKHLAGSPAAPR